MSESRKMGVQFILLMATTSMVVTLSEGIKKGNDNIDKICQNEDYNKMIIQMESSKQEKILLYVAVVVASTATVALIIFTIVASLQKRARTVEIEEQPEELQDNATYRMYERI